MASFTKITSHAVVITSENIDTDQIIPARFLKVLDKDGLGKSLFCDWRYNADGTDKADFPLNFPASQGAQILLAGDNFGCGSSREHAPWSLMGWGLRAVISTSFADIFKENSLKNGVLTITLDPAPHAQLIAAWTKAPQSKMTVDLEKQTIDYEGLKIPFTVNSFSRTCLLEGLDELGYIIRHEKQIATFEASR